MMPVYPILHYSDLIYFGEQLQKPLLAYHAYAIRTFASFEEKTVLKKTAEKVISFVLSPIAYSFFSIFAAIGVLFTGLGQGVKLIQTIAGLDPDKDLHSKIAALSREKNHGWQKQAVNLIRKRRYNSPHREIARLRTVGILTKDREANLDKALSKVYAMDLNTQKQLQAKAQIGQALEIKEVYRDTHYTFIHAQATKWLIFSYIVKEFTKKFYPTKDLSHYKFLRAPCTMTETSRIKFLWNMAKQWFSNNNHSSNVQSYLASLNAVDDSTGKEQENLLSVDGYFFNHSLFESSLYFLVNNSNILENTATIENFSKKVIKHFCPSLKNSKALSQYSQRLVKAASYHADCGNLFVICLPKKDISTSAYRSHPFGVPCNCHSALNDEAILESLQHDIFDTSNSCTLDHQPAVPQYRIYTPILKPGTDQHIYLSTSFSKKQKEAIKKTVRDIVNEVHLASQFQEIF